MLSISERGCIEGSVVVPHVVLNGTVKGDVRATERVELGPKARVIGNVQYKLIEMSIGAEVNGKLIHESEHAGAAKGAADRTSTRRARSTLENEAMEAMTDTSTAAEAPPLNFTDAAAHKVGKLIEQEGNSALKLRVYVQGGGCSGFQYGFTFDEEVQEGDTEIANGGVTLLVDPMSVQYLMGAEIDYREDLSGAQFIIRNPNAATTCGCGSSFSV